MSPVETSERTGGAATRPTTCGGTAGLGGVSPQHVGEGFAHVLLQPGDILVGDGAYSRAKHLLAVAAARAFALVRYSAAHLPLYAPGAPAWTREYRLECHEVAHPASRSLRTSGYGRGAGGRLACPSDCPGLARGTSHSSASAETAASPRPRADALEQALFLAGFVLLVTTLPAQRGGRAAPGALSRSLAD